MEVRQGRFILLLNGFRVFMTAEAKVGFSKFRRVDFSGEVEIIDALVISKFSCILLLHPVFEEMLLLK
jgi:hypothetical protein